MPVAHVDIKGLEKLTQQLKQLALKAQGEGNPVVTVGFTAAYALAVHEDMEMKWKGFSRDPRIRRIEMGGDPARARPRARKREPKGRFWDPQGKGQAKFLEHPAQELQAEFGKIIMEMLMGKGTLAQGLLKAGLRLQREAQLRVPVDTGNLKNSAFTRLSFEGPTIGTEPTAGNPKD